MTQQMMAIVPSVSILARSLEAPLEFSKEQSQIIRDSFANGATESEFAVLMETARVRRLNPLLKQIFFIKRWDGQKKREVWACQVSIDGLRAIAERTGKYDGQEEPQYEYDKDNKLVKATVRIWRKDISRPFVGVAFFAEYAQKKREGGLTQFWAEKPHVMIAKCAEALAFRKGFPEDTAGLYVPEEMGNEPEEDVRKPNVTPAKTKPVVAAVAKPAAPAPEEVVPDAEVEPVDDVSLEGHIAAATTTDELNVVGKKIGAAKKAEAITVDEYKRLSGLFSAKAKELKPS